MLMVGQTNIAMTYLSLCRVFQPIDLTLAQLHDAPPPHPRPLHLPVEDLRCFALRGTGELRAFGSSNIQGRPKSMTLALAPGTRD